MNTVAWHPTHLAEFTATGADKFAGQTYQLTINSVAGILGRRGQVEVQSQQTRVAVFVSSEAQKNPHQNYVIIYFGAGVAGEQSLNFRNRGLNDPVTHGLRSALDGTPCVLICIPGGDQPDNGPEAGTFFTIDDNNIKACLSSVGRDPQKLDYLQLCAFSRGQRGLRETLKQGLIRQKKPDLITIFDAAYADLEKELAGIPGRDIRAYQVTQKRRISIQGSNNIDLDPLAMRAIGYSRAISNRIYYGLSLSTLPLQTHLRLSEVKESILNLPPKGTFSSGLSAAPGAININEWVRRADNAQKINNIIRNEKQQNGLLSVIQETNSLFFGVNFVPEIYSHHLFVAEFAHELGWPTLGMTETFRNP